MCTHTAIFKTVNQQGPTVEHRELCSMLCGSLDGREVWERMDTYIRMAESLRCSPETITTLLIGFTPIQNKKFLKICKDDLQRVRVGIEQYPGIGNIRRQEALLPQSSMGNREGWLPEPRTSRVERSL